MHFIYAALDPSCLNQGDVLARTPELDALLAEIHPHYARHASYKYFLVLTQSCDLVRRKGAAGARYISIAAVRPLPDVLKREAEKYQDEAWQRQTAVVNDKAADQLNLFLRRLIDNNEPGYFYLHYELSLGIQERSCAFLPLSIALKASHYELLLRAKIAQLTDTFQAKLGWLVGTNFNRVGTEEWDEKYPANKVAAEASAVMKQTLRTVDTRQIKQGLSQLTDEGRLQAATPEEILGCVTRQKVLPPKSQFRKRLGEVLEPFNPYPVVRGRVQHLVRRDQKLAAALAGVLDGAVDPDAKREAMIELIAERVGEILDDPERLKDTKIIDLLIGKICADAKIESILARK